MQIDDYTPDHDRTTMTDALKYTGYPGFLNALREAPKAGTLDVAGDKFTIRWARTVDTDTGRVVTIVTDQPVAFVGQGRRGAKSTAGYEVAVMQLTLDKTGHGYQDDEPGSRARQARWRDRRAHRQLRWRSPLTLTRHGSRRQVGRFRAPRRHRRDDCARAARRR